MCEADAEPGLPRLPESGEAGGQGLEGLTVEASKPTIHLFELGHEYLGMSRMRFRGMRLNQ